MNQNQLKNSEAGYDKLHSDEGFAEEPEYYEILGSFLRGNKSVDIGCGSGLIEIFSPDTVAVDFSKKALEIAKKKGAKTTVQAPAEKLPFKNDEFQVSLSNGVLEHCVGQTKAVSEMVRVSKIQILIVHAKLPFPFAQLRPLTNKIFGLKDQPVENPLSLREIKRILKEAGSRTFIEGVWNYIDPRWIWKRLPYGLIKWPSHYFIVGMKTNNTERKFLGDMK
ncbi:MAG: S-adenosylmethionine-dependent methyltransferase [uncultured bacterium]|nr:MAG: S-adenosylmethionine-dependent methyltransferase [uncultured bacterium]